MNNNEFFKVTVFPKGFNLSTASQEELDEKTRVEFTEIDDVVDNLDAEDFESADKEEIEDYFSTFAYNMSWGEIAKNESDYQYKWEVVSEAEMDAYENAAQKRYEARRDAIRKDAGFPTLSSLQNHR